MTEKRPSLLLICFIPPFFFLDLDGKKAKPDTWLQFSFVTQSLFSALNLLLLFLLFFASEWMQQTPTSSFGWFYNGTLSLLFSFTFSLLFLFLLDFRGDNISNSPQRRQFRLFWLFLSFVDRVTFPPPPLLLLYSFFRGMIYSPKLEQFQALCWFGR